MNTDAAIAHECGHAVMGLSLGMVVKEIAPSAVSFDKFELKSEDALCLHLAGAIAEGSACGATGDVLSVMGCFKGLIDETMLPISQDTVKTVRASFDEKTEKIYWAFVHLVSRLALSDEDAVTVLKRVSEFENAPKTLFLVHAASEKVKTTFEKYFDVFSALFHAVRDNGGQLSGERVMEIWNA